MTFQTGALNQAPVNFPWNPVITVPPQTSYAFNSSNGGKLYVRSNNGVAMTDTLVAPNTNATPNGWYMDICNLDASASLTLTPIDSTISNDASVVITPGQVVRISSDGHTFYGALSNSLVPGGDVSGIPPTLDNAIARFNGIGANVIQGSGLIISDLNEVTGITSLTVGNLLIGGNAIYTTNVDGNLELTPDGNGMVTSTTPFKTFSSFILTETSPPASDTITLQAPAALASSYTLTLPIDAGLLAQSLTTNGAGGLTWTSNVVAASPATDNALVRFNGTTGALIQNSLAILSDAGALSGLTQLTVDNVDVNGNTISTTDTNGNLILAPNGSGITTSLNSIKSQTAFILEETGVGVDTITLQAPASIAASYTLTLPIDDGTANQVLATDGNGVLSWVGNVAGNVIGPGSATDTAIALFNGTTGSLIKNSVVTIDGTGIINTAAAQINFSGASVLKTIVANFDVAVGQGALASATSGVNLTAVGNGAGNAITTSNNLSAFGYHALLLATGAANTAVGSTCLSAVTSGANNTGLGNGVGAALTTGAQNTLLGATTNVTAGSENYSIGLGFGAVITASNQLAIGSPVGGQGVTTVTTARTAGTAAGLPVLPTGYLNVLLNGASIYFPYYS